MYAKIRPHSCPVLKNGGYLYLEVPFLQGFHADPYDYQRYTQVGLKKLVEKFNKIDKNIFVLILLFALFYR